MLQNFGPHIEQKCATFAPSAGNVSSWNARAVTDPGSAVDRLVIRTFNDGAEHDADAADLAGGDRHIVPPRTSVEMGERLGMFDESLVRNQDDELNLRIIRGHRPTRY